MGRRQQQIRKTLLVVGEGDSEVAFLKHLRELYCCQGKGVTVTIRNAHGKGPDHVVDHAIRQARIYSYDSCVAFLDTDLVWTDRLKKKARQTKIDMVGSSPCFEGLLLSVLGMRVPLKSVECKQQIDRALGIDLTDRKAYPSHFPRAALEGARKRIAELDRLLVFFTG